MFSDLHCSTKTLDTCLLVLENFLIEARKRKAGVFFLGKFIEIYIFIYILYIIFVNKYYKSIDPFYE